MVLTLVESIKPHTIIEIGVQYGGSLKFWEQIVDLGDLVIGVDIDPQVKWKTGLSDRRVVIIKGDSTKEETVRKVAEILGGKYADFLYIDGDHALETCKSDFRNYSRFVRDGGLVGFHDLYSDVKNPKKVFDSLVGKKIELHAHKEKGEEQGSGVWWKL